MRKLFVMLSLTLLTAGAGAQTLYCLDNDSVNHYLNDFSYDTIPDLNVSFILNYYDTNCSFRLDWPKPVGLSWTKNADAVSHRIEISESEDMSDPMVYAVQDTDAYDVYNLIPGRTYYYKVIGVKSDDSEVEEASSSFGTTGFLRMMRADGTLNVRDMGGWTGLGGHKIAYGKIFRGGRLRENKTDALLLEPLGKEYLRAAGIRAEIDLRSDNDTKINESPLSENGDVDYRRYPRSVNARMYHYDANESNIEEIQFIINELKQGKPVYYHCSMGADRTGTLGFLLGALFGMSEGDLAKDYEITTFCSKYTGEEVYETFARLRNYRGKMGSPDGSSDPKEYMFAPLIDKLHDNTSANTNQRKIYDFLKKGVQNSNGKTVKISESDLDWLIKEMVDYTMVKKLLLNNVRSSLAMTEGETFQLDASYTPLDATDSIITYKSNNTGVVTITPDGLITAVGAGSTYIYVSIDGLARSFRVTVTADETNLPEPVRADASRSDNRIYNVSGQETDAAEGLYIMDGKKYLNK